MATTLDPNDRAIVNYDEPPVKPPPMLAVGPLAWVRENLFKSTFDTVLTIVSAVVLVSAVIGLLQWSIGSANWFVVTGNLRLFLAGTFPADALWRLEWALRIAVFLGGFTLLAYVRVGPALVVLIGVMLLLLFAVPVVTDATIPPVTTYLAVGSTPIVSGTVTEIPQDELAFVAKAGETVRVQIANLGGSDDALSHAAGFTDRASAALINAVNNRLQTQQEMLNLQEQLDHGLLTDAQRADFRGEVSTTDVPPALTETYSVNTTSVQVTLINGTTGETLDSATLTADSAPLTVTLPDDGWYVLQKTIDGDGTALLETTGIYPLHVRNLTRDGVQIEQYERMIDGFNTEAPRAAIDGSTVPIIQVTDNQYQGLRSFGDYLRMFVAPFFRDLGMPFLQLVIAGVLGYYAAFGLARVLPAVPGAPRNLGLRVRGAVTWLWLLYLIALFLLAYGVQGLSALGVGLLLSRFVWVGWMYFTGMNLDRVWGRPLLGLVTILGVAQSVIAEGLLDKLSRDPASAIGAILGVVIWLAIGLYAARMGRGARGGWTDSLRLRAVIGSAVVWLILFIVPPLLIQSTTQNVLPLTDTRRWGGFLLTALLTIVAILASFPLGVLLALGRRSSLPVVKWTCIVYIELVRGVPLITVLFMAQLLVPLVNPSLAEVDNVIRAMIGLTLFSAAYLAENVRGGLQSIPGGQEEAGKALGLSSWQVTLHITLPQALRAVIPALVGQAIALFKDTSLVSLVGLIDLLGESNTVIAQPEYIGLRSETYVFIGVIYFVVSYLMAWISRRIEASGSGAARRV